ncbi:MAG: glycosyltransferase family A protein [Flavobacteriaceae bacterium]|nr:glycosyltransferase family 2 protein [Flavobacteriaceae bacterium]
MTNAAKKSQHLEILLSTIQQNSLSFLSEMFPYNKISDINIVVINQTEKANLLVSDYNHVKVFNSFEKGLSNSRNLAIEKASGEICLLADDDVVYAEGFEDIILSAFQKNKDADIITFQMMDDEGHLFRDYQNITKHNETTVYTVNSVVIAFKLKSVKDKVNFNTNFGLGAQFEVADEYVFLRDALKAGLTIYFEPQVILKHSKFSSGQDVASDRLIYGRSALYYKYYGLRAYFRIAKHIYLTFKEGKLRFSEIIPKFGVAFKGIKDYKKLVREGFEIR